MSPGRWQALPGSSSRVNRSSMRRGSCSGRSDERRGAFRGTGRAGFVWCLHCAADRARAGRFRARARMSADPFDRAASVDDDARAGNLQRLQFLHPAGGAVLPPDGEPDEHRWHHRSAGRAFPLDGRALPGSLAQINVVLSVFFAGISGSSTADAASQSKIFIDAQTKEGYDLSFSIAITAVSAVLAVIIPPSILMIVWGGLISTSIAAMYLAGIIPGLLIAGAQMLTVHVYAVRRGYPT